MVKRLLYLSGLGVICVVLFHTAGTGFTSMFFWAHRYLPAAIDPMDQVGNAQYYFLRLLEQIAVVAIPIFLFVSGYFIAISTKRSDHTVAWPVIFGRIKKLIPPYLIWSGVVMVLNFIQGDSPSIQKIIVRILTGSTGPVLYFVPLLIQFYLLAPFLVPPARNHWGLLLGITALLQVVVQLLQYPLFLGLDLPAAIPLIKLIPKWLFLARIFWFPLGMVVGFHLNEFKTIVERYRYLLLAVTILAIPLAIIEWELYFHQSGLEWLDHRETILDSIYSIGAILTILGFSQVNFPAENSIGKLGSRSYGIFLTHAIIIEYTGKLFYHFQPHLLGNQWLLQPVLFAVGLGLSLLLMAIVARLPVRNLYTTLFG